MESLGVRASAGLAITDDPKKFSAQNIKHNMLKTLCMATCKVVRMSQIENMNTVRTSELYQEERSECAGLNLAGGLGPHHSNTMSKRMRTRNFVRHT